MQLKFFPFLIIILLLACFKANSQDIVLLEKPGTVKNFKFYKGSIIKVSMMEGDSIIEGEITGIQDSGFILNNQLYLRPHDIHELYKPRKFFSFTRSLFLTAGISYFALDITNRTLNTDKPFIHEETLIISSSLILAGIGSELMKYRVCRIDNFRWRIRILKR